MINIVLVNVLTNPLVVSLSVYMNLRYGLMGRRVSLVFLEIWAFYTEGFLYRRYLKYKNINPYLLSIVLNLSSKYNMVHGSEI